jgi:hypothetical protein
VNSQLSPVRRSLDEGGTFNSEPSVELRIEELVLNGFAPGDRYAIGDTVERELARLLDEQGVPRLLRVQSATDEIRGVTFNAAQNSKPPAIGRQIAQAVYQRLDK